MKQVISIDFDHTIFDNAADSPMDGVHDAIDELRMRGHRILIHSANRKTFIKEWCEENQITYDWIWDDIGKPPAVAYIDDRAVPFRGNWKQSVEDALVLVETRPIGSYIVIGGKKYGW